MFDGSFAWFEGPRFPQGVEGSDHWKIAAAMDFDPVVAEEELRKLRSTRRKPPTRARLFIPHRRSDLEVAKRLAFLANKHGLDYWLDAEDAALSGIDKRLLTGAAHALAVAMAIEIALINCSHLCSLVTPRSLDRTPHGEPQQSGASLWTPYA